jgi:hypothetical protein
MIVRMGVRGTWSPPSSERAVLLEKLTQFRRFITGTVAPHAAAHPSDKWVKHIIAQIRDRLASPIRREMGKSPGPSPP